MVLPLLDLGMSVWPVKLTTIVWRFGTMGLFASAVGAPLLVLFLIYALAYSVGDRKVVIGCGVVAGIFALMLLVGTGSFTLDALQMKSRVPVARLSQFYTASAQATIKLSLQGFAALILTVSIIRTIRDPKLASAKPERNPSANLVVGRSIGARTIERADQSGAARALADGSAGQTRGSDE